MKLTSIVMVSSLNLSEILKVLVMNDHIKYMHLL